MAGTGSIAVRCCVLAVSIHAVASGVAALEGTKPLQSNLEDQVRVQMKLIDAIVVDEQGRTVPALSKAAKAVGAHGIMVEIHPDPLKALSDGPQALTFPDFARLMADLHR